MRRLERGSTELVVIGLLVVALLGAVGYIAWNKINTKQDTTTSDSSVKAQTEAATSLKKFCTPKEKICFDYPNDWSVTHDTADEEEQADRSLESITIADSHGKKWLYIYFGLMGLGGACDPTDSDYDTKLVKTEATGLKNQRYVTEGLEDRMQPAVQAVALINRNTQDKTWGVSLTLSNMKSASHIGNYNGCEFFGSGSLNAQNNLKDEYGSVLISSNGLGNAVPAFTTYASEKEATAALNTAEARQAFDILKSVRYE